MDAGKIHELFHAKAGQVRFQTELIEASYPRLLSFGGGHRTGHEDDRQQAQIALSNKEIAEKTGYG